MDQGATILQLFPTDFNVPINKYQKNIEPHFGFKGSYWAELQTVCLRRGKYIVVYIVSAFSPLKNFKNQDLKNKLQVCNAKHSYCSILIDLCAQMVLSAMLQIVIQPSARSWPRPVQLHICSISRRVPPLMSFQTTCCAKCSCFLIWTH